eukprot:6186481-Pleurochrysis_carterae.AAC.4
MLHVSLLHGSLLPGSVEHEHTQSFGATGSPIQGGAQRMCVCLHDGKIPSARRAKSLFAIELGPAVSCAAMLAFTGLYMARRGMMTSGLSRGLSQFSMKIAIPCLLFRSIVPGVSYSASDAPLGRDPIPLRSSRTFLLDRHF